MPVESGQPFGVETEWQTFAGVENSMSACPANGCNFHENGLDLSSPFLFWRLRKVKLSAIRADSPSEVTITLLIPQNWAMAKLTTQSVPRNPVTECETDNKLNPSVAQKRTG